ncbi:calcium-dependent protein kinase 22-like [Folsomia candida]|uniref:Interferon-induced, double-stranded RNA-activated protein kinase n=1 Tax=Folsomia candida TaxID=158441 RepID=A0A226DX45_FOLCA|nr:calcium-dependent protein kinase 22-like [Folsomia candida]OXA49833.1 Interferon-induced, double-stranded RNA-activated protein kinase [Folsomia candida]
MAAKYPETTDLPVPDLSTLTLDNSPPSDFIDKITKLEYCLGHGAFGVVLKAKISSTFYAVKFLLPNQILPEEKARREFEIPLTLRKHDKVVQIHKFVEEKVLSHSQVEQIIQLSDPTIEARYKIEQRKGAPVKWTCIQMELCGRSLRHWLEKFKPPNDSIYTQMKQAAIAEDVIEGMLFLHKSDVIHRDLKPENIMFTSLEYNLPVKIGDFGLARRILPDDGSTLTSNIGTRSYMAPEILDGKYSYQADIFSLGLVLWELTALIPSTERPSLFNKLVYDKDEKLVQEHPLLGPVLKQFIISCTKRSPIDRLKSMTKASELLNIKKIKIRPQEILARTSEELQLCLKFISSGCTIRLVKTTYFVGIGLCLDNVNIIGQGSNTIIDLRPPRGIYITGSHCTLSDLKIACYAREDTPNICVTNSHNKLHDVILTLQVCQNGEEEADDYGIIILGDNHILQRVTIENTTSELFLIFFCCQPNLVISDLYVTTGHAKIVILSDNTSFKRIDLSDLMDNPLQSESSISELPNEQLNRRNCPPELRIVVAGLNCNLEEIKCTGIIVDASNASLHNVQCSGAIQISGGLEGIALKKCEAKSIETDSSVTITDCKLGAVSSSSIDWPKFRKVYVLRTWTY